MKKKHLMPNFACAVEMLAMSQIAHKLVFIFVYVQYIAFCLYIKLCPTNGTSIHNTSSQGFYQIKELVQWRMGFFNNFYLHINF